MFGDEADRERSKKFFVYGAIFVHVDSILAIHDQIERARREAGLAATDTLKSTSRGRPEGLSTEGHRNLKQRVMMTASEAANLKFCAQVTLHDLARNIPHDELVRRGANTILGQFNAFLAEQKACGYAVLDNLPVEHPYRYLKEKFQLGLIFPKGPARRLDRVLGLAQAAEGTSHMCSVADVLLGAFRYCVNDPDNEEAAKAMFPTLISMMWRHERNGKKVLNQCGLVFRPAKIDETKYQTEYDTLEHRLLGYLG
jgi:hypothetical protein